MPNENCNFPVITWYSVITWYFFLQNIVDNLVFSALTWKICSAGKFAKTLLYNTRGIMAKSDTTIMFSSHIHTSTNLLKSQLTYKICEFNTKDSSK